VQAAGYSAEELRMRLAKACGDVIYNDVTPHVSVATMTGARVYVGGEVAVPGVYPLRATPTALQAIMLARGELDTGWLEEVTVIRRNPQGKPYVFRTNLKAAIEQGYTDNDIPLRAFDLVYVPKSPIAKADLFVKQYIDDLVPFSNSLGVSGVYYLNTQDVDTESRSRNLNLGVTAAPVVAP
jgi:protein involved in polysaccharide export with SLBB domain